MSLQGKRYTFETVTFKQKFVNLPARSKVDQAKIALSHDLHCSPAELHIFWNGREYTDNEQIPEPENYTKKYPIVYRHVVLAAAAQAPAPVEDPPDFADMVATLLTVADNKVDKGTIERLLREANYDGDSIVERVLEMAQDPAAAIPPDVRQKLEQHKPSHLSLEEAINLYTEACGRDLEQTLAILRGS